MGPLAEGRGGHADEHDDDIIPAFGYIDENGNHAEYPGKNLDNGGQAILDNGCKIPPVTTTPPTTTSTGTTTTGTTTTGTTTTGTTTTGTTTTGTTTTGTTTTGTTTGTSTRTPPGRTTSPRPIPSGGVDTGNSGLVDDGSFNAPAALGLLGVLGLAGGTAVAVRRRGLGR
ncbi:MAG: hypothetical protein ACR2JG_04395 [Geodermatophilaceae bacterium]